MRKFKFTLQSLDKVKRTIEKQLKTDLGLIEQKLQRQRDELAAMERHCDERREEFRAKAAEGTDAVSLQRYSYYFQYMRENMDAQRALIEQTLQERAECQKKLVTVMSEIKALEKLKEAQYAQYLLEVKQEEEKIIGDFVSFQVISS